MAHMHAVIDSGRLIDDHHSISRKKAKDAKLQRKRDGVSYLCPMHFTPQNKKVGSIAVFTRGSSSRYWTRHSGCTVILGRFPMAELRGATMVCEVPTGCMHGNSSGKGQNGTAGGEPTVPGHQM